MPDDKQEQNKTSKNAFGDAVKDSLMRSLNTATQIGIGLADPSMGAKMLQNNLGFNQGVRDIIRDVPWAVTWLLHDNNFWGSSSGDQQWAPGVAQGIQDFWNKYVSSSSLGKSEFRMATGWQLPDDMKYNGQLQPKDAKGEPIKEINDISSIFYKNKTGQVEVMTYQDPRWADIVGPYMATQIGAIIASGGVGTVVKGAPATARSFTSVAKLAPAVLESMDTAGSIGVMGNSLADPIFFKPTAIRTLGNMFADPKTMTTDKVRSTINTFMSQYSHIEGPMIEQYYIPSLKGADSPWKQLEEISQSRLEGFKRHHAFDDIRGLSTKDPRYGVIENSNVQLGLENHSHFNKSFYDLAERALSGGLDADAASGIRLNDAEVLSMRFMLNIKNQATLSITGDTFNQHQRDETMDVLRAQLSREMGVSTVKVPDMPMTKAALTEDDYFLSQLKAYNTSSYSDGELVQYAKGKEQQWQATIDKEDFVQTQRMNGIDPTTGQPKSWGPKM